MKHTTHTSPPKGLEKIKHIVVLMFENRSYDHLFGDFSNTNGLVDQNGNIKPDYYNLQNPLSPPDKQTNPKHHPTPVDPNKPLAHDFTHDFGDGMMPDIFGPVFQVSGTPPLPTNPKASYQSGYTQAGLTGNVTPLPQTYPSTNSGFYTTYNSCKQQGQSVMSYFRKGDLKVLHQLADEFVLCDNWHCDMPGHTEPNRAFMHCGQTGDAGIDDSDGGMVNATSIFDLISQQSGSGGSPSWTMYAPVDNEGNLGQLDTRFLNSNLQFYSGAPITQFADDCANETLSFYSFIMCWLPNSTAYTDTSMHPAAMIQPGENLLAAVYNTLRNSSYWEDTLLVVTFDENGGIYDHVAPPTTTPPVANASPATQSEPGCCGNKWVLNSTFDFSLLGFRVPALLISPWLAKGIDQNQYQNTSLLKFLIDTMNKQYGTNASNLTDRDQNAPSLESAFFDFGLDTMRTDCPEWLSHYTKLPCKNPQTDSDRIPYSDGMLTTWEPPSGNDDCQPVSYINELMNIYVRGLPGHPDSGKKITRQFATNSEVKRYLNERRQAAGL